MHPVFADQIQNIPVLWKKRHRRDFFALEDRFQVVAQGKTRPLQLVCGMLTAKLRFLNKFLGQGFHGAQDLGGHLESDHFERTNRLVQLLAGDSQLAAVQRRQVRAPSLFGVVYIAAQRLGGAVERLA